MLHKLIYEVFRIIKNPIPLSETITIENNNCFFAIIQIHIIQVITKQKR